MLSPYSEVPLDEPNEKSIATRLVYKETSMLLTGDASKFNEYDMVSVYGASLESEVLKLGHHGSKTSSSELFLDTVRPEFVVVSAGCDNRFSHPSDVVVDRVKIRKIKMLDTCSFGDIVFTSNGTRWKLE